MVRDQGRAAPLQLRLRIAARHRPPRCRSDRCSRAGARRAAAGELPLAIVYAMLPLIIYNSMLIYAESAGMERRVPRPTAVENTRGWILYLRAVVTDAKNVKGHSSPWAS